MSGSFSRSFLKVERSLVFAQRECPIHFREFPVSTALPQRFCKNCQTSVLFRLGAINFHLRLHGQTPACQGQRAGASHCSRLCRVNSAAVAAQLLPLLSLCRPPSLPT